MTDQTDRQRAEDELRGLYRKMEAELRGDFRREGWEAGREEAATVLRQEGYSAAASRIRALKPKE